MDPVPVDQIPVQDQNPTQEVEGTSEVSQTSQSPKITLKQKLKTLFANKKFRLGLAGFSLLAVAAVGWFIIKGPGGPKPISVKTANAFTLAASSTDSLGINPQSQFTLKSKEPIDAAAVKAALTINPKTDFEIKANSETEFTIAPKTTLGENTVYRFGLAATETNGAEEAKQRDYSWAFQIKNPFRVIATLPRDEAAYVPTDTGIEVTFSHEDFKDSEKYFEITPQVTGFFEKHKRTMVFAPHSPLAEKTLYTVKIKKGLPLEGSQETLKEDYIFQFETASTTSDIEKPYFYFNRDLSQFPSTEAPALDVWLSYNNPAVTLDVWVYQFKNETDFINALKAQDNIPSWSSYGREQFRYPTEGLPEVVKFTVPIEGDSDNSGYTKHYIRFPEKLNDGFYLVKSSTTNQEDYTFLQISNLSGYLATSQTKSVVWINDLTTKQPVAGAKISLVDTGFTQSTTNEGAVLFETPSQILKEETPHYFRAEFQGKVVILPVTPIGPNATPTSSLYWKYLYTDRTLYLPTDTIKFWGLIQKRENHQQQTLTATLTKYDYFDYFGESINIYEQDVLPSDWGTFNSEMQLKNLQPGSYYLNIKIGDEVITSRWLDVQTYHKPAYKIDIETEKKAIIAGDTAVYKIKTQFFEGTPVPNLRLKYSGDREGELTTDASGEYTITHQTVPVASPSAYPNQSSNLYVRPTLPEEGQIGSSASVRVFNSTYTIDAKAERTDGRGEVIGTVYQVDLQKLNSEETQAWDDYKGAPVQNQKVNGKIYEQWWDKIETGEYYDFINKKVRKTYRYQSQRKHLDSFAATTGENGQFKVGFDIEKDKDYQIELTTADPQGRINWTQVYISGGENQFQTSEDIRINSDQNEYKIGDEVGLTFKRGDEILPSGGNNRYLYFLAQNGIREFKISADSSWRFLFAEKFVPNIVYKGVYFNGETYQENGGGYSAHFEPSIYLAKEERELKVEITPDKESYEPGEQVNLDIKVTDQNEKGVAAEVNVSLIDEALSEISWTGPTSPLNTLYSTAPSGVLQTFVSHQYPLGIQQGGGGGGGGGPRDDFKDNAFFGIVQTGGDGKAKTSFKLPDNLTSWRATTQAISKDLYAGGNTSFLPVKLPLFVDATFNDTYLTADKPVIKFRAFGAQLTEGQNVTFTVKSETLEINSKVTGKAFSDTEFALPALKEGKHNISIKGEVGDLTDELVRTIRVVSSRVEKTTAEYYDLSNTTKPDGSQTKPTTLIFADRNRGQYYSTLLGLAYNYGDRVDQRLAQVKGRELLQEYFEEQLPEAEFTPSDYQAPEGGIALLPYSDTDLGLSAKVANVAGERFDTESLIQYLYSIVDSDEEGVERISQALFGLAALDEPVLNLINQLLENTKITPRDGVFLGLALDKLGDQERARQVYAELISKYSEETTPYLRLKIGKDQDDFAHYTALVSMLASDLEAKEKEELIGYTLHSAPKDLLLNLEKLAFTETELPKLEDQPAKFSYQIGGESKEVSLQKGETFKLQVSPQELAQIKFEVSQGSVGLTSQYNVPATTADLTTDPSLSLSRKYTVSGRNTTDFSATDLVRVELSYGFGASSLDGLYRINDFLPSGLRVINQPYGWNIQDENISYPYKIENQEVSFARTKPYTKTIYYYARVLNKGEYVAEPAFIQSAVSLESINSTTPQTVTIR